MWRLLVICIFACSPVFSQDSKPLEYLEEINESYEPVLKKQLDFALALAQGQPAELVGRLRTSLLTEIRDSRNVIRRMPPHRGNSALRDSLVQFLDISYDVVNEDYARIVDMEQISRDSYDKMEAYLRSQEEAYERMSRAARAMKKAEEDFAKKFGIRLVNSDDRFSQKLNEINEIFSYYNNIYLVFFNAYQQELNTFRAVEKRDPKLIDEETRKLNVIATEGLALLDKKGAYKGDKSLRNAATRNLRFYQQEAQEDLPVLSNYYGDLDKLRMLKSNLDQAKDSELRKKLTEEYNTLVREINASAKTLDALTEKLNYQRAESLDLWNRESESFLRRFIE